MTGLSQSVGDVGLIVPPAIDQDEPSRPGLPGQARSSGGGSSPNFVKVSASASSLGGEQDVLAGQGKASPAEHLALDHLKSYVESAGVMMFPRCDHGLGRWIERHGGAEGEVAGARPA